MTFSVFKNSYKYNDKELRKIVGLVNKDDLTEKDQKVTTKIIRNFSDASALNVVSSVYTIFIPQSSSSVYTPWGKRHKTYLVYDASKRVEDVSELLYAYNFQVGPSKVKYKILRGSIRSRRLRKGVSVY